MAKVVGSYEFQVIIILVGAGEVSPVRHGGYGLQTYITLWDPNLFKQKFGSTSTSTELTSGGGPKPLIFFYCGRRVLLQGCPAGQNIERVSPTS
jgi:hypothetical protein